MVDETTVRGKMRAGDISGIISGPGEPKMERMVNLMKRALVLCIASAIVLVAPAVVPEAGAQGPAPDYYGTGDTNYHYVSAEEFQTTFTAGYVFAGDGFWAGGSGLVLDMVENMAPLRLPSGALVDGYTIVYDDSDAVWNLELELNRYWVGAFGATGTSQIGTTFTSSGTPGVTNTWVDLDPNIVISYSIAVTHSTQSYAFTVRLAGAVDVRFRGVIVHWKRQASPAPATAPLTTCPQATGRSSSSRHLPTRASRAAAAVGTTARTAPSPVARWRSFSPRRWACTSRPERSGARRRPPPSPPDARLADRLTWYINYQEIPARDI